MKKIIAHFESVDFADLASGHLKRKLPVEKMIIRTHNFESEEDYEVNYPIKPDYLDVNSTRYLEGMPHILSNGPIYNEFFEPKERYDAVLKVSVNDNDAHIAVNILMKYGGHDISVKN